MKARNDMQTAIIIFLSAACITLAGLTVYLTFRVRDNARKAADMAEQAYSAEEDVRELIQDKIQLINAKEAAEQKVRILTAMNAELIERKDKPMQRREEIEIEQESVTNINVGSKDTATLIPEGHTNTYRCEDYRLFAKNSEQAMLQDECFTDTETGIRYYQTESGRYYCAAMATAYGTEIGQAYEIQLNNGSVFNVIVADFKHDISKPRSDDYGDSDINYDGQDCTNVIEFVVDMDKIPQEVKISGSMSALDRFGGLYGDGGDIVQIESLGRKWRR